MEAADRYTTMASKNPGLLLVRQLLANRSNLCAALLPHHNNLPSYSIRILSSFSNPQSSPNPTPPPNPKPFSNFSPFRSFSSSPAAPSNVITIKSEDELNSALSKAEGDSLPAMFYFTAVWCGPCRFIAPVIGELSEKYPHVTTFKIDIDQEGLGSALGKLNISSVPTFHFFQNGEKADEFVGADATRLKDTYAKLYKPDL
ncbi:PREDICTED: thioredoxin O2, mitochondrial [Fragaria vesca subsp. vesca]|uniref:thioredoxin O2, mitochondrial n=1 Tax=Fragaria vesca subsp. vesca TaxID=101020 RepID=UPI0002C2FEA3|nr:PREDICTED: thioredoxin O2, mitochondrial [Fragaria vesca subsp. vesca]